LISEIGKGDYQWKEFEEKLNLSQREPESFNIAMDSTIDFEKETKLAEKDLKEKISTINPIKIYYNPSLKLYSSFEESKEEFISKCEDLSLEIIKEKAKEVDKVYNLKLERIREQVEKEKYYIKKEEEEASLRATERNISLFEAGLSILFGGKKTYTKIKNTISKAGQVGRKQKQVLKEKMDVEIRRDRLKKLEEDLISLNEEFKKELKNLQVEAEEKAHTIEEIMVYPLESKSYIEKISVVFINKNSLNLYRS